MDYRDQHPMSYSVRDAAVSRDEGLRTYMLSIYNLMASALALTGLTAYLGANWEPLRDALYTVHGTHLALSGLGWLVAFAPLAIVFFGFRRLGAMSLGSAQAMYWTFAALNGLSLSALFFAYTGESIMRVFLITAILFGSMSMWGYATKKDLTGMGQFLFMGVWGIVIASLVNIFLGSSGLQFAVSVLGVVIFTGLTAYDTQKLKGIYYQLAATGDMAAKFAIIGALNLYLDFINLFIMLLRLMGDRRN